MATIYCPKCGAPNDSSSTFCGNCGYTPQASEAGTFYSPQGQQKGANELPPPPPPFRSGSMPSSPTYATNNMPSSPTYSAGNMPPSPAFPTSNMLAPPTYPMSSTPSSPTYSTGTMPSSTYAGDGTNLLPPQTRRGKKGIIAILAVVVVVILVAAGLVGFLEYKSHNTSGVAAKPTATPGATATLGVTATTSTTATPGATTANPAYPAIDNNVGCQAGEQLAYHIHAYVVIYINGQQSSLPANTGIASDGSCLYWLHTHDTSGVIHEESPDTRTFILGNFLDEWEQVFSQLGYPSQLDLSSGWTVYVDGSLYKGNFRTIPLHAHTIITMAYNSPNVKPVTNYNWNGL